jgi:hypothetical protein
VEAYRYICFVITSTCSWSCWDSSLWIQCIQKMQKHIDIYLSSHVYALDQSGWFG